MGRGGQGGALSAATFELRPEEWEGVGAMAMGVGEECSRQREQQMERCEEMWLRLLALSVP